MPYLIKRRSNNAAVTYRMFPVDNVVYYSVPANPAYLKGGKWTKPYDPDNFGGLINDYIEEYTPFEEMAQAAIDHPVVKEMADV